MELLVHGITYTRDYWMASPEKYKPEKYSWVEHALKRGFPVLAIDRIGNGLSTHPDPITALQMPYEVQSIHSLIEKIRAGATNALPRSFDQIVYVGHSYGSSLASNLLKMYPDDVEAAILTGFSSHELSGSSAAALASSLSPATSFDHQRFGTLPPGYVVTATERNRSDFFYHAPGHHSEPNLASIDFATMDTVGIGELAGANVVQAPKFRGKIYVLTGNEDKIFCGNNSDISQDGNCGSGDHSILDETRQLFPAASTYDYYAIPDTGHCVNFHYSAPAAFNRVHNWLENEGF
ncbi:hypothetical protein LMH87_001088 [Akanthomyces muscarius]|uniref:AB hydrolase-1 domain-containing protein n=1 Tax=Akanthomyces muscarius TaxID=2231603 RepID=A0A9W8QJ68_AKAMU|nr:hypothetical protein LMH87_001088 [Akanthomyces muscarius]KAJ4155863.1 hypothetical protein LMH87_001088 [Akanthomyces muscarius]